MMFSGILNFFKRTPVTHIPPGLERQYQFVMAARKRMRLAEQDFHNAEPDFIDIALNRYENAIRQCEEELRLYQLLYKKWREEHVGI